VPAGLGGAGWLAIVFETVMGTYLDPTTVGTVWVPILDESLTYNEDKYYSPQIRQSSIVMEQKQSYYHVAGDVRLEVDPTFLPYFLYCSRHTPDKAGDGTPYVYNFTPSDDAAAQIVAGSSGQKTASITIVRNDVGFGYAGCVLGGYTFAVEDGILICTMNVLGLSEETPADLGSPAWVAPNILGADSHSIYTDTAGVAPAFAGAVETNFNGFEFAVDFNAEAQNRIRADREASYISYGETVPTLTTELDFESKTEYDNFKNSAKKAVRFQSIGDGLAWGATQDAIRIDMFNMSYDEYSVNLGGMSDLVMAGVTMRALGIAAGVPYRITVKNTTDIAGAS